MSESQYRFHRLPEFDYSTPGAYFITVCTNGKRNYFWESVAALTAQPLAALPPYGCGVPLAGCERPLHRLPLTRYGRYAAEAIRDIPKFYSHASVDQSVVMPNHIHLLLRLDETPGQAGIPQIVRQMKAHVSKRAGFSIWQRSYYDHVIRGQKDYDMIWQYIADNTAKWLNDRFYEPDEP